MAQSNRAAPLEGLQSSSNCGTVAELPKVIFNDMGSEDFRETFLYTIQQLNILNLGYVHIMDGLAFGFHEKGTPMSLAEFRKHYDGVIIENCGYTKEDAEEQLAEGVADIAAIGRTFISNPDLVKRWQNNWPLSPSDNPGY